jgi:cell division protein FtsI/penicillin-binding protein 2
MESEQNGAGNKSIVRLKIVFLFSLIAIVAIIIRLFYVQVINREYFITAAKSQHITKIEMLAKRGKIYDRNMSLLVSNILAKSFAVDPLVAQKDSLFNIKIQTIIKILNLEPEIIKGILSSKKSFVWLRRGMIEYEKSLDTINIPWFLVLSEPKRIYLYNNSASSLLGITNIDNKGISGLELMLDSLLRGKNGEAVSLRDAQGRLKPTFDMVVKKPIDGKTIVLTLDIDLQRMLEYHLANGVQETKSRSGCAIAMNPTTGEILALATYPNFDLNNSKGIDGSLLLNPAVNYSYEPGSAIKPIIAAIALDNKIIGEDEVFEGFSGKLTIGDVNIIDEHPLGKLNLEQALAFSSNIVFAQISSRLDPEILINRLKKFGFGSKTGIELPGEQRGNLPEPAVVSTTRQKFIGFGYGIAVTPIQLLTSYSAIANKGYMVKPHIIKGIYDGANPIWSDTLLIPEKILEESVAEKIKHFLIKVIDYGTGISTRIEGISIAGKTGTAQKFIDSAYSKTHYVNFFVGFFPAENPRISILLMLEEPKTSIYAGTTVVPIFKRIVLSLYNSSLIKLLK